MSGSKIAMIAIAAAVLACENEPLNVSTPSTFPLQASQSATQLPFHGSFSLESSATFTPPNTLTVTGNATGTATQLGRFTAMSVDVVDATTTTSTGTFIFTAANGDQLFATTTGEEDEFIPPNTSSVALVVTITGGTGRFAGATGSLSIHSISVIDFATETSSGSGSLTGHINLNR